MHTEALTLDNRRRLDAQLGQLIVERSRQKLALGNGGHRDDAQLHTLGTVVHVAERYVHLFLLLIEVVVLVLMRLRMLLNGRTATHADLDRAVWRRRRRGGGALAVAAVHRVQVVVDDDASVAAVVARRRRRLASDLVGDCRLRSSHRRRREHNGGRMGDRGGGEHRNGLADDGGRGRFGGDAGGGWQWMDVVLLGTALVVVEVVFCSGGGVDVGWLRRCGFVLGCGLRLLLLLRCSANC